MRNWLRQLSSPKNLSVYTDGAIDSDNGLCGLAAVVFNDQGKLQFYWSETCGRLTCNQAEYQAALMALERLHQQGIRQVDLYSDSQVMVHQMTGLASARNSGLRQAQARLRGLASKFDRVTFHHIPREHNLLADAAARSALNKQKESSNE